MIFLYYTHEKEEVEKYDEKRKKEEVCLLNSVKNPRVCAHT